MTSNFLLSFAGNFINVQDQATHMQNAADSYVDASRCRIIKVKR